VYQDNAYDHLTYMSWPQDLKEPLPRYIFDDSAGEGVSVYVVDTGADLQHSVGRFFGVPAIYSSDTANTSSFSCRSSTMSETE
jgi:hypothetical protein